MDLADVDPAYQVDLPRLRQGGADCLLTYVGDNDLALSSVLIDAVYEMCRAHPDDFAVCRTRSEVLSARAQGQIAIVMTIEGQKMLDESLSHLRNWHRLGVRVASITHGGGRRPELQHDPSYFGYIDPPERENLRQQSKGLTPFGREALAEMGRLGIAVDLAHINDAAFWEVLELAECPVCYTHGGVLPTDMVDNSVSLRDDPNRPKTDAQPASILTGRGPQRAETALFQRILGV